MTAGSISRDICVRSGTFARGGTPTESKALLTQSEAFRSSPYVSVSPSHSAATLSGVLPPQPSKRSTTVAQ